MHDPLNLFPRFAGSIRNLEVLRKLGATRRIIHVHANSFDRIEDVEGVEIPMVIELCYLRRNRARFVPSRRPFPGSLDVSNSAAADIPIGALLAQR
jgi:hypothetical protein